MKKIILTTIIIMILNSYAAFSLENVEITDFEIYDLYSSEAQEYDITNNIVIGVEFSGSTSEEVSVAMDIGILDDNNNVVKKITCYSRYDKDGDGNPESTFGGIPCENIFGYDILKIEEGKWKAQIPKEFFNPDLISQGKMYIQFGIWKKGCIGIPEEWYDNPAPNVPTKGYHTIGEPGSINTDNVDMYLTFASPAKYPDDWRTVCKKGEDKIYISKRFNLKDYLDKIGIDPYCYLSYPNTLKICHTPHKSPVISATLFHYGNYLNKNDLIELKPIIEEKFKEATGNLVELEIKHFAVKPLPSEGAVVLGKKHDYSEIKETYPWLTGDSVKRIWYYHNFPEKYMVLEVFEALESLNKDELLWSDVIIVLTEIQFEGLAFEKGRMLVLEYPLEVAWGLKEGHRVEEPTEYFIADEVIHEMGHYMGLKHSCESGCFACLWKNDVMSYCRERSGEHVYKYSSCTKKFIKNQFVPFILNGGEIIQQEKPCNRFF